MAELQGPLLRTAGLQRKSHRGSKGGRGEVPDPYLVTGRLLCKKARKTWPGTDEKGGRKHGEEGKGRKRIESEGAGFERSKLGL